MHHEIFTTRLKWQQNDLLEVIRQKTIDGIRGVFVQDKRMIKLTDDFFLGDFFNDTKIYHKSLLRMIDYIVDGSGQSYMEVIGMAMDVLTRPIVSKQRMCHIERKNFGNPDDVFVHGPAKIAVHVSILTEPKKMGLTGPSIVFKKVLCPSDARTMVSKSPFSSSL